MKKAFLGVLASIYLATGCLSLSVVAQTFELDPPVQLPPITYDTLDPLPDWSWRDAFELIVPIARRTAWRRLDSHIADSLAVYLTGDSSIRAWKFKVAAYPHNEDCRVLAWRTLRHSRAVDDSQLIREALVSVRLTDLLGQSRWMLALLDALPDTSPGSGYHWDLAHPHFEILPPIRSANDTVPVRGISRGLVTYFDYMLMQRTGNPVSVVLYDFIARIDTMRDTKRFGEGAPYPGFFDHKPRSSQGSEWIFLDGAVRVNTWKHVTGEAPTVFLPNGK